MESAYSSSKAEPVVKRRWRAIEVAEMWAAVAIVVLAAWLRLAHLGEIPSCLEYDEAANVILSGEIARGQSFPVFIRPYTGKEALYFYLAAGLMRLAGVTPFALRLTSAFLGILNVPLTYWFARQLFAGPAFDVRTRRWLSLSSAALVAVSYWQVHLSRLGYRAIVLPPLLALTFGSLLRGINLPESSELSGRSTASRQWAWIALAGAWAGLSAYTYASVRVLPVLLLIVWIGVLVADRRRWRVRLRDLLLFGLAAAVVFAPLGVFFLRYPETFSVRLDQVSVFSPAVHKGDLWGTLRRTLGLALIMFTVSGDVNPLYNDPGRPVFDRILGPFFYLGLLVCAWRMVAPLLFPPRGEMPAAPSFPPAGGKPRRDKGGTRLPYLMLFAWLPVMMIPNILSASGVPHNLRAMALVPAVYVVVAVGLVAALQGVLALAARLGIDLPSSPARFPASLFAALLLVLLVGYEGARTYRGYLAWAASAGPYYKGNEALIHAASLLNGHPEADPYVATYFQQHATLAVHARDYGRIRWMSRGTLVLPPLDAGPAILVYDHTNPVDPVLRARVLPAETAFHRERGPDGEIGFEAFWLDRANRPVLTPQYPANVNLGNTLTYLGYDLNAPAVSGGTADVTLYLNVDRAVDRSDLTFFVHLVDDLGFRWAEETFFDYPSAQWRPGEVILYRLQLAIAPGAPPGDYGLDVGVFSPAINARLPVLNDAGQMAGTVVSAGPIQVASADAAPDERPVIQQPQEVRLGDDLLFLGADRDRSDLLPGQTLALTLYWQALRSLEEGTLVSVELAGAGEDVPLWRGHPVQGRYPFHRWQHGEFIRDRYALRLPLDTPAGDLDLRLSLLDARGQPIATGAGETAISLGTIHVRASDRLWAPPVFAHPVGARLGSAIELLGYDLVGDRVQPGDTLHLTLVWRCLESVDTAYTVFTHLLDASGQLRGQKDNPPVDGTYPTTLWVPGEVVVDRYAIPIAADAVPGRYAIEVGMYDPATIVRLPVLDPGGAVGDRILLGEIAVGEAQAHQGAGD